MIRKTVRWVAVGVLVGAALGLSACTPGKSAGVTDAAASPAVVAPDPACAAIQQAITADLAPFGSALGSAVGDDVARDAADRDAALVRAATSLKKLAADLTAMAAQARTASLRTAAVSVGSQINGLAASPTYLSGITSMADISDATAQLVHATAPVAAKCQSGS
jgi:hypothetical protein